MTGTYCILVPFASYVLGGEKLTRYNLGAALLCLAGIGLVALDSVEFNSGDAITLGGAVFFAIQMAVTAKYGCKMDINVITFWMFVGKWRFELNHVATIRDSGASVRVDAELYRRGGFSLGGLYVRSPARQNVGLAHVRPRRARCSFRWSPLGRAVLGAADGEALTLAPACRLCAHLLSIILSETHFDFLRRKSRPQL